MSDRVRAEMRADLTACLYLANVDSMRLQTPLLRAAATNV